MVKIVEMSLFKEKDEYITKLFNQFNESDDDFEDDDLSDSASGSREVVEEKEPEETERPSKKLKSDDQSNSEPDNITIISLSDESSSNANYLDSFNEKDQITRDLSPDIICDTPQISIEQLSASDGPCTRSKARAKEVIILSSSDEEISNPGQASKKPVTEAPIQIDFESIDLDDYDFNLKLTLAGCYKQFKTTYKTKLRVALDSLISEVKAQGKNLTLCMNNETVSLEETPYSLSLTSATILKAIEIQCPSAKSSVCDPNIINIKLQDGNRKHTREFKINKHEPIVTLKELYAKEFNIDSTSRIKLMFDGDMVEDSDLPVDLEIEDDCVLDVMVN